MPFIIHVTPEDVALWEEIDHGERWNYRLIQRVYRPELDAIKVSAPERLDFLIDRDMRCWINIEEGYLSEKTGSAKRVHLALEPLKHPWTAGQRRLRLAIERVDTETAPPRVMLKTYEEETP